MARERGNDQHGRLFAGRILPEMKQVAKRIGGHDLFGDRHLSFSDRYGADAKVWPVMRHAGIGQQFQCGRSTSNERRVSDERPWLVEKTPKRLGDQSNWTEYVVVYLV